MPRTGYFDEAKPTAEASDDLPRSYLRFGALPAKAVHRILAQVEPTICNPATLASIRNKADHAQLLWYALGIHAGTKLLAERTWTALHDWVAQRYDELGRRLSKRVA